MMMGTMVAKSDSTVRKSVMLTDTPNTDTPMASGREFQNRSTSSKWPSSCTGIEGSLSCSRVCRKGGSGQQEGRDGGRGQGDSDSDTELIDTGSHTKAHTKSRRTDRQADRQLLTLTTTDKSKQKKEKKKKKKKKKQQTNNTNKNRTHPTHPQTHRQPCPA